MQPADWDAVPPGVMGILNGRPLAPAEAFEVSPLGCIVHAPRALNVRSTAFGRMPTHMLKGMPYRAQEKLDGVYVVWTGRRLLTKVGTRIEQRRFQQCLPPSVAIVGELYAGSLGRSTALVRDVTHPDWRRARLVAFDMMGLPEGWVYAKRYELLCHVVAAWNHRLGDGARTLMPLQVVRQHDMDRLGELFLAVVHGMSWSERRRLRLLGFGCPVAVVGSRTPDLLVSALDEAGWIGDTTDAPAPWEEVDMGGGGEGLMLWHQGAVRAERGRAGRGTESILKYKPTVLTVAIPYRAPYLVNRTDGVGEEGAGAGGYHVRLRWRDPIHGHDTRIVGFVGPGVAPSEVLQRFPLETAVFATFVAFGEKPHYVHAMGAGRLSHWEARQVQIHASVLARAAGRVGDASLTLDDVAVAARWRLGEMRGLFPWDVEWSPHWMCRAAAIRRDPATCPEMTVDVGLRWPGEAPTRTKRARKNGAGPVDRAAAAAALQQVLYRDVATWARGRQPRVVPFLVGCMFTVARWAARQGTGSALWFTGDERGPAVTVRGLLREWGPFRVDGTAATAEERWAECWLRLLVTIIASVWLRVGAMVPTRVEEDEVHGVLTMLHTEVGSAWEETAAVRYGAPEVRALVLPPNGDVGLMPGRVGSQPPFLHLGAAARYAQRVVGGSWQATEPPWASYIMDALAADRKIEAVLSVQGFVEMVTSTSAGPTTGGDLAVASVWARVMRDELLVPGRWKPQADAVRLERATMEPMRILAEGTVAPPAAVEPAPVQLACTAALRAMATYM